MISSLLPSPPSPKLSNSTEIQDNISYHHHLSSLAAGSSGSGIGSMISVDLKLERLGDMSMETLKNSITLNIASSSSSSSPSPLLALSKRGRPCKSGAQNTVFCSVDGCASDLTQCREYHRRHKVCERHSKTHVVIIAGKEQRFYQQCRRFQSLEEFDEVKRSCRKRLDGHNRRRRKRQPEAFYMPNSAAAFLSSHTADGMLQFFFPQTQTVNWPTMSQPPDLYLRNNQETIYQQPLLNVVAQNGSRTLKVSTENSGFALSLLSRYSSDICVEPAMQPTPMSSSTGQGKGQGSCTSLHLNNSFVQFSCSHGLEDMETSASLSSRTHNITRSFGGFQSGHNGFREPRSSRIFPFGWE